MSEKNDKVEAVKSPTLYSLDEICANSVKLFGKKREVVIGALYSKGQKTEFSIDEVQKAIDEYLKKEVKGNVKR